MLTKLKKVFVLVMFVAFIFVLAGCKSDLDLALEGLTLPTEVKEDFTLPSATNAVTTWASDNEAIIKVDGTYAEVFRPSGADATVKLTATVDLGGETGNREFVVKVLSYSAPDEITIKVADKDAGKFKYNEDKKAFLLTKGVDVQLEIQVADEEMSTEVKWSTSSKKRAEISEGGVLSGVGYGEVTVSAVSTSAANVKTEIKVLVVEDTSAEKVLIKNRDAILAEIPRFISADHVFPMAPNENVETLYFDSVSDRTDPTNAFYYGEYAYLYDGIDRQETIYCVLKYDGAETEFEFVISVVGDEENNEFLALDYAKEQIDGIFKQYVGGTTKFDSNVEVPESFTADEALYDVEISYEIVTSYQPYPIKMEKIGEEGAEKLNAVYYKPNDDAAVRVEVYCRTANNDAIYRYNLTAAGYTKDEIVEYISTNVLPQPNEAGEYKLVCQHITLPSGDSTGKFSSLSIEWTTSDATVLTETGKFANPALATQTAVTLTANIKYGGTVDAMYGFEESVEIQFDVYPAENKAQAVALQISNYIDAPEFYDLVKYFPFGKLDRLDADNNVTNVMPLPKKVSELTSELAEYADLEISWAANEEGLLDENYKLLKQYLRYHEVVLTYSITVDGNTASGEIVINVGITEVKNAIYIGGNYYQQSGTGDVAGDVLCSLSKFDAPVGVLGNAAKTWGYSYSTGQFGGMVWYMDVTDEVTGAVTRYQYFAAAAGLITLDDMYECALATEGDVSSVYVKLNDELNAHIGSNYGGNWAAIYHNVTDHEVKIPLSPLSGQAFLGNSEVTWGNHPWQKSSVINRDNAFGMDGYRAGFVCDKDGNVITGFGEKHFQHEYDADGDGQLTEADYWVTIPAGGYAYTPRTQQNNATINGKFCVVGTKLNISYFDPYFSSPDGSAEGLNSWKHE